MIAPLAEVWRAYDLLSGQKRFTEAKPTEKKRQQTEFETLLQKAEREIDGRSEILGRDI